MLFIVNQIIWYTHKITIQKVITHIGIIGNEIADQLVNDKTQSRETFYHTIFANWSPSQCIHIRHVQPTSIYNKYHQSKKGIRTSQMHISCTMQINGSPTTQSTTKSPTTLGICPKSKMSNHIVLICPIHGNHYKNIHLANHTSKSKLYTMSKQPQTHGHIYSLDARICT